MRADLHCHTINSDGVCTLKEVINLAKENNIDILAITDHDNIGVKKELDSIEIPKGFRVILGVELSTRYQEKSIHILGYFNDEVGQELKDYFDNMKTRRENRIKEMIRLLKIHYDIEVDYDSIVKKVKGVIARPHLAREISEKYNISFKEAFDKYLNNQSKAYVPASKISTKDGIELLKRNNALVVWAHPIETKGIIKEEDIINFGIDGIEGFYPKNKQKDTYRYKLIADDNNILFTAGSDFHDFVSHSMIGTCYLEGEDLDKFLNKLEHKKKDI